MSDDKRLRYDVLMTAIGIVDQDPHWRKALRRSTDRPKENDELVTDPLTQAYINKAKELMTFVDDISDPTVKNVTQLLTEHASK
jgi:hypothetical protein